MSDNEYEATIRRYVETDYGLFEEEDVEFFEVKLYRNGKYLGEDTFHTRDEAVNWARDIVASYREVEVIPL